MWSVAWKMLAACTIMSRRHAEPSMKDVNTPRPKVCVMTSRRRVERSIEHVSKCTKTLTSPHPKICVARQEDVWSIASNMWASAQRRQHPPPPEGMCGMCDHAKKPCLDADEGNEHIKKKNTEFATGGGRINYNPTLCNWNIWITLNACMHVYICLPLSGNPCLQ